MSKLKYMLGIVAVSSLLVSCDNHIIEDYSWHSWKPGMVYCTNGDVGSYEECVAKGHQPEAVIFYVDSNNETDGAAYAVALRDSYEGAFEDTDTVYSAQGTSADITELDGETNTTALRYFQIQSPIAQNVAAKYFIPSVAEMYKLYAARNVVNSVIEQCGGDRCLQMIKTAGTGQARSAKVLQQTGHGASAFTPADLSRLTSMPASPRDRFY